MLLQKWTELSTASILFTFLANIKLQERKYFSHFSWKVINHWKCLENVNFASFHQFTEHCKKKFATVCCQITVSRPPLKDPQYVICVCVWPKLTIRSFCRICYCISDEKYKKNLKHWQKKSIRRATKCRSIVIFIFFIHFFAARCLLLLLFSLYSVCVRGKRAAFFLLFFEPKITLKPLQISFWWNFFFSFANSAIRRKIFGPKVFLAKQKKKFLFVANLWKIQHAAATTVIDFFLRSKPACGPIHQFQFDSLMP